MERVPSLDEARFFVDEDLSELGIALTRLRRDVIVGRRAPAIEVVPKDDPPMVKNATQWDFMMILARHWSRVDELAGRKGPAWLELRRDRSRELRYLPGQPPRLPSGR
ncbi:MAG: hypothetical protein ACRDT0_11795 [Pseudonocardiaceae bacterium]